MSPAKRKRDWLINLILAAALSFVASMVALTLMEHAGPKVLAGPRMLFVALSTNDQIIHPFSLNQMTSEMERTGNQPANSKNQALNMHQAEQISHSATLVTSETQTENRPEESKIERMQMATGQADIPKDQYASTATVTAAETVRQARPSLACLEKRTALPPNELIIQPFSLDKMTSEMERTGNQPANSKNQALNMHQAEQISHSATLVTSQTQMNNRADKSKIEQVRMPTRQADIPKDQYASTATVTGAETVRQARPSLTCLEKGIAQCIHRCSFCLCGDFGI